MDIFNEIKKSKENQYQKNEELNLIKKNGTTVNNNKKKSISTKDKEKLLKEFSNNEETMDLFKTQKIDLINIQKIIRIPKNWHLKLQTFAKSKNLSINEIVRTLLTSNKEFNITNYIDSLNSIKLKKEKNDFSLNIRFKENEIILINELIKDKPIIDFSNYCKVKIFDFINQKK